MTTSNDITGDKLKTKPNSDKFRSNWDAIFKNKGESMKVTTCKPNNDGLIGSGTSNSEVDGL